MFQFDAAVNPQPGGPVQLRGELWARGGQVKLTGVEGLGAPSPNDVIDIVSAHDPGLSPANLPWHLRGTITPEAAEYYNRVVGAGVEAVTPGSAADRAGIKVGDIIIKLGEYEITSTEDLIFYKRKYKAGDTASITVNRGKEELVLEITFDEEGVTPTANMSLTGQ